MSCRGVWEANQESISQGPAADPVRPRNQISPPAFPSACEQAERGLLFHLPVPSCKQEVMERLTGRFDIDEIRVLEPSLNDIFVEYTKERI